MNDSAPLADDSSKLQNGPLHLQKYLGPCNDNLADTLKQALGHPVTLIRTLHCQCAASGMHRAIRPETPPANPVEQRTREARRSQIESGRMKSARTSASEASDDRRLACRFFSVKVNDEESVVHAICRRCERLILLYDRALYWGIKRPSGRQPPETFPYKCSCGGHMFEICLGFLYPPDTIDENDLDTISIAVRCASCNEVAVIFDDEAT